MVFDKSVSVGILTISFSIRQVWLTSLLLSTFVKSLMVGWLVRLDVLLVVDEPFVLGERLLEVIQEYVV
jgi:hypothetical protein